LPAIQERLQWQAILTEADYFTLVRMTEIPAQPKLTDDRKLLRLAAILQLGKIGKLGDLIAQRRAFDKGRFSLVQLVAWEAWAEQSPVEALAAWHERVSAEAPKPPDGWWVTTVAKGLAKANADAVAASLVKLPEAEQAMFIEKLAPKESK
jgi:hypothetical protein